MMQKTSLGNKKIISRDIMSLERMGSRYASRLSFSRSMLRTMVNEKWEIRRTKFDLNK